jgi:hypothetical protein
LCFYHNFSCNSSNMWYGGSMKRLCAHRGKRCGACGPAKAGSSRASGPLARKERGPAVIWAGRRRAGRVQNTAPQAFGAAPFPVLRGLNSAFSTPHAAIRPWDGAIFHVSTAIALPKLHQIAPDCTKLHQIAPNCT